MNGIVGQATGLCAHVSQRDQFAVGGRFCDKGLLTTVIGALVVDSDALVEPGGYPHPRVTEDLTIEDVGQFVRYHVVNEPVPAGALLDCDAGECLPTDPVLARVGSVEGTKITVVIVDDDASRAIGRDTGDRGDVIVPLGGGLEQRLAQIGWPVVPVDDHVLVA